MSIFYFYLILLLLIFVLIFKSLSFGLNFATLKIKLLCVSAFSLLALRYIVLLIFFLSKTINYLYIFKSIYFLNLLCLPILALVSIYILARQDKFKLNYCITFSIVLLLVYIIAVVKLPVAIDLYGNLGYRMYFLNSKFIESTYLIINTVFLFGSILLKNKNSNSLGIGLIYVSAFIVIIESIIKTIGISIIPVMIFGDVFWCITANYALYKLKK